jgi:hypothetical protein
MEKEIIGKGEIKFEGEAREFDVADRNIPEAPKYFIGYNNGRPFISDEVPERFRKYMVLHELVEFEKFSEEEDSCYKALRFELMDVVDDDIYEYVPFRAETFEHLINYLKQNESDSDLLPKVKRSCRHLNELIREFNL